MDLDRMGVRELRANVAAAVRRAADGERITITVDGRPAARLGPIEPVGSPTLDDLAAAGLVITPERRDRPGDIAAEDVPVDVRPGTVLDELRGR